MRRTALARLRADTHGAAAVEFALVLPVMMTFIFGVWFMGWSYNLGSEAGHAVELGSRIYIVNPDATQSDLQTAVASHLSDLSISNMALSASTVAVGSAQSEHIVWSYQTTPPIPFISAITFSFGGSVDVPLPTP